MLIKWQDGNVTRFCRGNGPPWETTIIRFVNEKNEEQRKKFEEMMLAVFNGKVLGEAKKGEGTG